MLTTRYKTESIPAQESFQLSYFSLPNVFSSFALSASVSNIALILCTYVENNTKKTVGYYNLRGCKGYPEVVDVPQSNALTDPIVFPDTIPKNGRYIENNPAREDNLEVALPIFNNATRVALKKTPGKYAITRPFQLTEVDFYQIIISSFLY